MKISQRNTQLLQNISCTTVLVSLLFLAFWIRLGGGEHLPAGQFTETDGYFYYWQASRISEHGQLPTHDMHRWLPLGRDLGQTLNLYGYVLAYVHKAVAAVFGNVTLYHVALYAPVVCFSIAVGALCLFLYQTHGILFSSLVGVLLATLPGSIERSAAGFGDRDAFCLMIGLLSLLTYLQSHRTDSHRKRLIWTLTSGVLVFLGGISWEGFGVFLSVILCVELYRFLSSETEDGLGLYALWVLCFVPTLYLTSPAYRNGYGFAEHLAAFVLMPPLGLLGMRALRHVLLSKVDRLRSHARTVAFVLILASAALGLGYVLIQQKTFAETTVPLSQNAVMTAMTELATPQWGYWIFRYGGVFILGSFGGILAIHRQTEQRCLLVPLVLFVATSFFREPLENYFSVSEISFFFSIAVMCIGVGFLISAWRETSNNPRLLTSVAFLAWFVFWVALARDAKRYDFFIGVPLAFFTAALITFFSNPFGRLVKPHRLGEVLKTGMALTLLAGILFLPPLGAHATRAIYAAKRMRNVTPSERVGRSFAWMKTALPETAIVAAHWAYGSQLNVLGGVKTIIDQDTYLQNWIRLYNQHVHNATSEREALTFLKTHGATHLLITGKDPTESFLHGELSEAFVPVYPKMFVADAPVKVWAIAYPADIHPDVKYLKTGFPEIDKDLHLH